VNNLPKIVTQQHASQGSNQRSLSHWPDATRLLNQPKVYILISPGFGAISPADATATHYLLLQQIQIGFNLPGFTFLVPDHLGGPGHIPEQQ